MQLAVSRLTSCLTVLAPATQRLLVLAAGVGAKRVPSVQTVARELHLRTATVISREKAALKEIGAAQRAGRCSGAPGAIPVTALPAASQTLVLLTGPQSNAAAFDQAATTRPLRKFIAQLRPHARPLLASRKRLHGSAVLAESAVRVPTGSGWTLEVWLIAVLGLLAVVLAGTTARHFRRRMLIADTLALGVVPTRNPSAPRRQPESHDPWWPASAQAASPAAAVWGTEEASTETPDADVEPEIVPEPPVKEEEAPPPEEEAPIEAEAAIIHEDEPEPVVSESGAPDAPPTSPRADHAPPPRESGASRWVRSRQFWAGVAVAVIAGTASIATRVIARVRGRRRRWGRRFR